MTLPFKKSPRMIAREAKEARARRRDFFIAAAITGLTSNPHAYDTSSRDLADEAIHLADVTLATLDAEEQGS